MKADIRRSGSVSPIRDRIGVHRPGSNRDPQPPGQRAVTTGCRQGDPPRQATGGKTGRSRGGRQRQEEGRLTRNDTGAGYSRQRARGAEENHQRGKAATIHSEGECRSRGGRASRAGGWINPARSRMAAGSTSLSLPAAAGRRASEQKQTDDRRAWPAL